MTLFAIVSKAPLVNIVLFMAGDAILLQLCRIFGFCMAGRTDQSLVLAGQRKLCRNIMIETPQLPAVDRVAARTL